MGGSQKSRECNLKCCFESNRFEEQLWEMAYQQLWPLARRRLVRPKADQGVKARQQKVTFAKGA